MSIYLESGYLDFNRISEYPETFIFLVGARGTGKTYGALKWCLDHKIKFIYTRRTQQQISILNKPAMCVFNSINRDTGANVQIEKMGNGMGKYVLDKTIIGYNMALSTFSNFRGFSAEDIECWILDEFIPESTERIQKGEGSAFLNAYETLNRNRELQGRRPLRVFGLANSNKLDNFIFVELGIVDKVCTAVDKGQDQLVLKERGLRVIFCGDSPISRMKADTALYRLADGTEFSDMALWNVFAQEKYLNSKGRKLTEYSPLVSVGEINIFRHKSQQIYYISPHREGGCPRYTSGNTDLMRFKYRYGDILWQAYLDRRIDFETPGMEICFNHYFEAS